MCSSSPPESEGPRGPARGCLSCSPPSAAPPSTAPTSGGCSASRGLPPSPTSANWKTREWCAAYRSMAAVDALALLPVPTPPRLPACSPGWRSCAPTARITGGCAPERGSWTSSRTSATRGSGLFRIVHISPSPGLAAACAGRRRSRHRPRIPPARGGQRLQGGPATHRDGLRAAACSLRRAARAVAVYLEGAAAGLGRDRSNEQAACQTGRIRTPVLRQEVTGTPAGPYSQRYSPATWKSEGPSSTPDSPIALQAFR
jgi:hypothetical protein